MAKAIERSYNGWQAHPDRRIIGVAPLTIDGAGFPGGVKTGDVATVLGYVATQFHARVEPLAKGWCWGYNYRQNRNANNLSCHASGTAIDVNAPRHPNGRRGTFTPAQVAQIRGILDECGGVVQWGGDFRGTPDEMHFEIIGNANQVAAAARRLQNRTQAKPTEPEEIDMVLVQAEGKGNAILSGNLFMGVDNDEWASFTKAGIKTVTVKPATFDALAQWANR